MSLRPVPRLVLAVAALAGLACTHPPTQRVAFPEPAAALEPGSVLVVVSAARTQTLAGGGTRETGFFLNELYEPYQALVAAGYRVVIATPGGAPAALDPESLAEKYWDSPEALAAARAWVAATPALGRPVVLAEQRAEDFQALLVPGGQGVMVDLLDDRDLHALITAFGEAGRPVGLVCHAPAILTRFHAPPFVGRRVTSVSGIEEWFIERFVMGDEAQVRGIGDRLEAAGYLHHAALPGRGHAVRDCNLVTSQNPFSGPAFGARFLDALADWRRGGRCAPRDEDG